MTTMTRTNKIINPANPENIFKKSLSEKTAADGRREEEERERRKRWKRKMREVKSEEILWKAGEEERGRKRKIERK